MHEAEPALNLAANAFGLDREGVRFNFLLPVGPERLILAKNISILIGCGALERLWREAPQSQDLSSQIRRWHRPPCSQAHEHRHCC